MLEDLIAVRFLGQVYLEIGLSFEGIAGEHETLAASLPYLYPTSGLFTFLTGPRFVARSPTLTRCPAPLAQVTWDPGPALANPDLGLRPL